MSLYPRYVLHVLLYVILSKELTATVVRYRLYLRTLCAGVAASPDSVLARTWSRYAGYVQGEIPPCIDISSRSSHLSESRAYPYYVFGSLLWVH